MRSFLWEELDVGLVVEPGKELVSFSRTERWQNGVCIIVFDAHKSGGGLDVF